MQCSDDQASAQDNQPYDTPISAILHLQLFSCPVRLLLLLSFGSLRYLGDLYKFGLSLTLTAWFLLLRLYGTSFAQLLRRAFSFAFFAWELRN